MIINKTISLTREELIDMAMFNLGYKKEQVQSTKLSSKGLKMEIVT
jgi:hypothetical protein